MSRSYTAVSSWESSVKNLILSPSLDLHLGNLVT